MPYDEAQLVRLAEADRAPVLFTLDGAPASALEGDTVLTAILTQRRMLRVSDFSGEPRAGFCLIGACQDCWIRTEDGARLRACSTAIEAGMRLLTHAVVNAKAETEAGADADRRHGGQA
ncbi:(2Fe-2S)-binding protein [Trinickia dinghuensis]|uniref:(2Fe-2S)-binding protein n=1 Tax=Trinickia dinghuensis TaxID=2291023 RepID=A0A3D8JRV2_9BURK|nr:(2Fe-2S)-binding protein [Trinickia dinghuensis]RDU95284.1 (2Fe-2S)-binding protein [Trinickia dinghuensis]